MIRKCAVTIRAEEAVELVPSILQRDWSEGALKKWKEQAMKEDLLDSSSAGKARARRLARMRAKAPSAGAAGKKPTAQSRSPAHSSPVQPLDPTKDAFELLENWV